MNAILTAIKLLGGLAMFLYGMEIMGDGLKQGSGTALKNVLGKLTHNVFLGLLTGTLVTAVIQSSTATIVLTVGLIGAGIPLTAIYYLYNNAIVAVMGYFPSLTSLLGFLSVEAVYQYLLPLSLAIGVGIGYFGSYFTCRKHLNV